MNSGLLVELNLRRHFEWSLPQLGSQSVIKKDVDTWKEEGLGIKLGDAKRDCTSNLRFADEVLMMANSLTHLKT